MCSGNELTALDTSYCDLLPDLFKNMPQVVEVTASCSSGFRGHSCQAPAVVPVEVQLRTKVNEIGNLLAGNRSKYLDIRSSWVSQNRWISLGTTAYKLTHIANELSDAFKNSVLETDREASRRQGEALFYTLVQSVTPSVTSFPPCSRVAISLVEKLAQTFCAQTASFHHLDTAIRFPSLAPILAPYFSPQPDSEDFSKMYSLVMERLNRGHTTLAFSLLSKFQMSHFAAQCSENDLNDVLFSIKSGLFALSGDAHGESNHDFDLPESSDSKDLVQEKWLT